MERTPESMYQKLVEYGDRWAVLDGAARLLEYNRRVLLADIVKEHSDESVTKAEHLAHADPRYKEHIQKMTEARTEANRAEVKWISAQAFGSYWQTDNANKRASNKF